MKESKLKVPTILDSLLSSVSNLLRTMKIKFISLILTASTLMSCGGGGGNNSTPSTGNKQPAEFNTNFLFGCPTGGVVKFYSGGLLTASYVYNEAIISGQTSQTQVYVTIYASGAYRNFESPITITETVQNGKHHIEVQNPQLKVASISAWRAQTQANNIGISNVTGSGEDGAVAIAFPTAGTDLTYSGDPTTGRIAVDSIGDALLFSAVGSGNAVTGSGWGTCHFIETYVSSVEAKSK